MRTVRMLISFLTKYCLALTTTLSVSQTLGVSNVSIPDAPIGFKADIVLSSILLNPLSAWLNAIDGVAEWSLDLGSGSIAPWDTSVSNDLFVSVFEQRAGQRAFATVVLRREHAPTSRLPPVKLSYVFLGLYQGIIAMTARNEFRELTVGLELDGVNLGYYQLANRRRSHLPLNESASPSFEDGKYITNLNGQTGRIIDPRDPRFAIDYSFVGGRPFAASDIFTAILDAMIETATQDLRSEQTHIRGRSSTAICYLYINQVPTLGPGMPSLNGEITLRVLRLIAYYSFGLQRIYRELEFSLKYNKNEFAAGWFLKQTSAGEKNETTGTALERRRPRDSLQE